MTEELTWNNVGEIVLAYRNLEPSQGFKIYQKTIDYDNTGEEVIVPQIIPAGFDMEYSIDVPISNPKGIMAKYVKGIEFVTWNIYDKQFTVNLEYITKIEIIDNAIDEILKEVNE